MITSVLISKFAVQCQNQIFLICLSINQVATLAQYRRGKVLRVISRERARSIFNRFPQTLNTSKIF